MSNTASALRKFNIPESNCTPGYSGGDPEQEPPILYYYYAHEDLGSIGDFDFNDVVLRVSAPAIDGTGEIQLCAAGGTMPTTVMAIRATAHRQGLP